MFHRGSLEPTADRQSTCSASNAHKFRWPLPTSASASYSSPASAAISSPAIGHLSNQVPPTYSCVVQCLSAMKGAPAARSAAKLQCELAVDVFLRRQEDGRDGR